MLPTLEPRITPERFNQLALQLVASGLCTSRTDVEKLVCTTFSGLREHDRNSAGFATWPMLLSTAIGELVKQVLLVETGAGKLVATQVGKAIAHSGLLPETGVFLLEYATRKVNNLAQ